MSLSTFTDPRAHERNAYVRGFRNWSAALRALILREIWRHGRTKWTMFTFALQFLEPVGVIAAFGFIVYVLLRVPPYGPSTILFHATGIVPYYYFIRVSGRTRSFEVDRANRLPCSDSLDDFLILCFMDFIVMSVGTVILFWGLSIFVSPLAIPIDPWACVTSVVLVSILACGINLVNAAIIHLTKAWVTILIVLFRGLMLISGVIFVVDFMPPNIRFWLNLNPLSHAIMWFRMGIYPHYPVHTLDKAYLVWFALGSLVVGLAVERATRNFEDGQ